MDDYIKMLEEDVRIKEGLAACINCGTCTAICPAANFYNYDPRIIVDTVQTRDNAKIHDLLTGDTIWYCGECMSCKTRCPRGNAPGLIIMALRNLSIRSGLFTSSEKGRQQLAIKRSIGHWILKYGYCLYREEMTLEDHPEQGPSWEWQNRNLEDLLPLFGVQYKGKTGALRKISDDSLKELHAIFEVTGGLDFYDTIEKKSKEKAEEMKLEFDERMNCEYMHEIYNKSSDHHYKS